VEVDLTPEEILAKEKKDTLKAKIADWDKYTKALKEMKGSNSVVDLIAEIHQKRKFEEVSGDKMQKKPVETPLRQYLQSKMKHNWILAKRRLST